MDNLETISEDSPQEEPIPDKPIVVEEKKKTFWTSIKNSIFGFCEFCEEFIERFWIRFWNRIQIKLFWFAISILIGVSIGLYVGNSYAKNKIEEYISLGGFLHTSETYDSTTGQNVKETRIYDIVPRVR